MTLYRRIIRLPKALNDLLTIQIDELIQKKQEIEWEINEVTSMPDGYHVSTNSGERIPKEEWLVEASTVLAEKETEITKLQGHQ